MYSVKFSTNIKTKYGKSRGLNTNMDPMKWIKIIYLISLYYWVK